MKFCWSASTKNIFKYVLYYQMCVRTGVSGVVCKRSVRMCGLVSVCHLCARACVCGVHAACVCVCVSVCLSVGGTVCVCA